jgi:hypothetical protein
VSDKYIVQKKSLDAVANEVKILSEVSEGMTINQITSNIAQANADVEAQASLIEQIKTALDGKAAGSGSEIIAQIAALIDQSGVLDSTEGTATEKVKQLIDKAEDENLWYQVTTNTKKIGTFFADSKIERLPRINFSVLTSLSYAFQNVLIKRIDDYMDTQNCTNFNSVFSRCKQLEYVKGINLSSATLVNACFANCTALKTIEEPIDYSYLSVNSTENSIYMFYNATALETIRIKPESIKKHFVLAHTSVLTPESIQSIIDGLAYVETAQTLTLHADVKAKLTETQLATITNKNWNLA